MAARDVRLDLRGSGSPGNSESYEVDITAPNAATGIGLEWLGWNGFPSDQPKWWHFSQGRLILHGIWTSGFRAALWRFRKVKSVEFRAKYGKLCWSDLATLTKNQPGSAPVLGVFSSSVYPWIGCRFFFLGKQPRDPDIQGGQNTHRFPVEGIHLHQSEIFPEKKHTLFPEKICLVVSNMAFIFHWPYMGYTILPIDELHHFSRWAHCTTNQVIINHH